MKKTSTSRRRKLPLLLGALLIISVAAYGTRAYFSDSESQQGNIKLELGTVDIAMEETQKWKYVPLTDATTDPNNLINKNLTDSVGKVNFGKDIKSGDSIENSSSITNVRPGDSFTKQFNVKNNGSLDVRLNLIASSKQGSTDVTFTNNKHTLLGSGAFIVTIEDASVDKSNIVTSGATKMYTVKITVPTEFGTGIENMKLPQNDKIFDYMDNMLTVKAVQTNAK